MIERSPSNLRSLLPWTIAAGCALTAAWIGRLYVGTNLETEQLRTQFALAEVALKSGDQQLEAERIVARAQLAQLDLANLKIAVMVPLKNDAAEARAVVIWNPDKQEGVFVAAKMPALAAQRWEIWAVGTGENPRPVSAGAVDLRAGQAMRASFKPIAPIGGVAKFVLSREKNDGPRKAASPTEMIMVGEVR